MPALKRMLYEDFQHLRFTATVIGVLGALSSTTVLILSALALHMRNYCVEYLLEVFKNVETQCDLRLCLSNFVIVSASMCYAFALIDILVNSMLIVGIIGDCCYLILPWLLYHALLLVVATFVGSYIVISFLYLGIQYFVVSFIAVTLGFILCGRIYQIVLELFRAMENMDYYPPGYNVEGGDTTITNNNPLIYTVELQNY